MTKHCSLREPIDNPFKAGTFALPALNGFIDRFIRRKSYKVSSLSVYIISSWTQKFLVYILYQRKCECQEKRTYIRKNLAYLGKS